MRPRLRTSGLERIAPVDASSWYTGVCKDTHRPHRRGVFLSCYTSNVPGGGVPEEITQLSSTQTYRNRFFIDPNLFAILRTILFMPKAFFATASIKGSLHTFMPYDFFFFHRNPWGHSIYSNTTLGRCFPERNWQCSLRPPPPSLHCFPAVFAPVYSCPYIIPESIPQRQVAISHVGHLSFWIYLHFWPRTGSVRPRAAQGKATSFPALPLTLIFWKWACCHSNCQITSIMLPLTSRHLL